MSEQELTNKLAKLCNQLDELTTLRQRVAELEEWKATEQQACIAIAVACLSTGLLPKEIKGNVEAVKFLCEQVSRLTAERDEARRLYQAAIKNTEHRVGGSPLTRHSEQEE